MFCKLIAIISTFKNCMEPYVLPISFYCSKPLTVSDIGAEKVRKESETISSRHWIQTVLYKIHGTDK